MAKWGHGCWKWVGFKALSWVFIPHVFVPQLVSSL